MDCRSASYQEEFRPIVGVLIVFFQALPLGYVLLLYRVRGRLNPKMANRALAMETRERDESLRPYRFLFSDYKLNRWYFEIVDLCKYRTTPDSLSLKRRNKDLLFLPILR